jgi:hypothetical protein
MPRCLVAVSLAASAATAACGDVNASFVRLSDARHLAADLQVVFTRAADAANRAVVDDTDAASVSHAEEAKVARQAVHKDAAALRPLLESLRYADEIRLLDGFEAQFAEYERLDRQILDLAVENTNLKAQRLSFESGQAAADGFRDSLQLLAAGQSHDTWQLRATTSTAVAAVREIQALQAPHIAEPDDASMTTIETRMKAEETAARQALGALARLVGPASRPKLAAATEALTHFLDVNAEIVRLSRRNTNVRALALSLNQKQQLIAPCEQSLRALRDALARHAAHQGRWG